MGAQDAQRHPNPHAAPFAAIATILRDAPVQYHQFDKLLTELDASIKTCYQNSNISPEDRKTVEKRMLIAGEIPDVLSPALETLLLGSSESGIEALREEINVAELYFMDFSWLELGDDSKSRAWRRENRVDVVRKTVLRRGDGKRLKRCTRCCAVMEDLGREARTGNVAVLQLLRNCLCGGWWYVISHL